MTFGPRYVKRADIVVVLVERDVSEGDREATRHY